MQNQSNSMNMDFENRFREVWNHTQRGLVYHSDHAIFSTIWLNNQSIFTKENLANLIKAAYDHIELNALLKESNSTVVIGVAFSYWEKISQDRTFPKGMKLKYPSENDHYVSQVLEKSGYKFHHSGGDLWLHVKSDDDMACTALYDFVIGQLQQNIDPTTPPVKTITASKSTGDNRTGKVLGCRFSENINNPSDPITLAKHTLIGAEDIQHTGGSYVLSQRFFINWDQINMMSEEQIEDLIGRRTDDKIIPDKDNRSHIKASRVQDEYGNSTPILRLGLPFGRATGSPNSRFSKNPNKSDEQGIYFAGFAKSASILEEVLMSQIGAKDGFISDRLFNHLSSDLGGIFYIPSLTDLGIGHSLKLNLNSLNDIPAVEWQEHNPYFFKKSKNGLMYYNHKNYLLDMAINKPFSEEESHYFRKPSNRILSLLENIFSLWQDNWYFNRKQEEIEKGVDHYIHQFNLPDIPDNIMDLSIMLRKGWAVRLSLHLFSSETYGFRGRRILCEDGRIIPYSKAEEMKQGNQVIFGSDTFRISPEEIIVGAMPNLTLGEGRYVMPYLTEQERIQGFIKNLSEASGVGHVIPNYEKALKYGLDELIEDIKQLRDQAIDQSTDVAEVKRLSDLYNASILSMQGISEYFLNYAQLAQNMAAALEPEQIWEIQNLNEISARMKKLAHQKPESFIEAVQFIFTLHSCLHLNGEPTAFGRMDQLLIAYYQNDINAGRLSEDQAQEIIDAFYIKLDEKVQQNRMFMEDHQPFGNLAMGGSAGPYPQGASLGQWIQQITVGGTVADGVEDFSQTKPLYNDVTRLFIRASGRLPLNAPCLSLRVRPDIPEDILRDAAHAILSGGAHPILLSDAKLIPNLQKSGDFIGGKDLENDPHWKSTVSMTSAQNYACDGCYEPQFPGENWFSLGGFSTLQPLECALNQGKTISSAGSSYLYGQTVSLTTKHAEKIGSFEELLALYEQHFDLLNRKAFYGQLHNYGANTEICPSPILNVLMDDCLAKGRDLYSGGAKYNIYGPCYISISHTINSLYAIKHMVFDEQTAVTTLPELVECLCCDWGYKMVEPFISELAGPIRIAAQADRYKRLRDRALSLPRYGRGHQEIDDFGNQIIERIATLAMQTFTHPWPEFSELLQNLAHKYGTEAHPFGIQLQPGVGTFENHVEMGSWNGASADGRRMGTSVASDLSPSASPADLPIDHQTAPFSQALAGFTSRAVDLFSDGAPTDFNINENFGVENLVKILQQFSEGQGSNILTITVADPETFEDALTSPEQYDLLRVRTGGWSNFFTSVFPTIQQQHQRRPVSTPDGLHESASKCPFH